MNKENLGEFLQEAKIIKPRTISGISESSPIIMENWSKTKIIKEIRNIFKTIHPDSLLSADTKEYLVSLAKKGYSDIEIERLLDNAWENARKSKRWTVRKVDFY